MTKTSLNLPYMVLTGVIVIGIVAVSIIIYPMYSDVSDLNRQVAAVHKQVTEQQYFLKAIDQKIVAINGQKMQEHALAVMLPTINSSQDMLRIINQTSTATGVSVSSINDISNNLQAVTKAEAAHNDGANTSPSVLPMGLQIKVSGSYSQIRDFLGQMEHAIRINDVTSVFLTQNTQQPDQLNGDLSLRFYMLDNSSN